MNTEPMETKSGTVVKIIATKGYGFIRPDDSISDLFFHAAAIERPLAFEDLHEGDRVAFLTVNDEKKGKIQCIYIVKA
jgi:cold shock CspA family protein